MDKSHQTNSFFRVQHLDRRVVFFRQVFDGFVVKNFFVKETIIIENTVEFTTSGFPQIHSFFSCFGSLQKGPLSFDYLIVKDYGKE